MLDITYSEPEYEAYYLHLSKLGVPYNPDRPETAYSFAGHTIRDTNFDAINAREDEFMESVEGVDNSLLVLCTLQRDMQQKLYDLAMQHPNPDELARVVEQTDGIAVAWRRQAA